MLWGFKAVALLNTSPATAREHRLEFVSVGPELDVQFVCCLQKLPITVLERSIPQFSHLKQGYKDVYFTWLL